MNKKELINIALVDDHTLFRDGLVNLLTEYDDIKVVFTARNGEDMKSKLESNLLPEVLLMDIHMPVMDGHESTLWVKQNYPGIRILALSMYEDDFSVIKMIKNGAGGYILKESNTDEVVRGIRSIAASNYFLNEVISGKLIHTIQNDIRIHRKLTPREIEFSQWCCSELTYKEVAAKMGVSPRTVDNYREALFEKLQLKSRVGLVIFAVKNNLFKW